MAQTIRQLMTANPTTLLKTATSEEAARLMREEDIGDIIVVDDKGKICGIVTDRDIALKVVAAGADPKDVLLEAIANKQVVTMSPGGSVERAISLMKENAIRRLPILENGKPIGVVSLGDLAIDRSPGTTLAEISAAAPDHLNGSVRRSGGVKAAILPAVAAGAALAFTIGTLKGRSRSRTRNIAAKRLRKASKNFRKAGAAEAEKAAHLASRGVKDVRKKLRKARPEVADVGKRLADSVPDSKDLRKLAKGVNAKDLKKLAKGVNAKKIKKLAKRIDLKELKKLAKGVDLKDLKKLAKRMDVQEVKRLVKEVDVEDLKKLARGRARDLRKLAKGASVEAIRSRLVTATPAPAPGPATVIPAVAILAGAEPVKELKGRKARRAAPQVEEPAVTTV
jgi:CBS domain-containing protein